MWTILRGNSFGGLTKEKEKTKRYLIEASVRDNPLGKIRGHNPWLRDLEVSNFTPRSQKGKSGQGDAVGPVIGNPRSGRSFCLPISVYIVERKERNC